MDIKITHKINNHPTIKKIRDEGIALDPHKKISFEELKKYALSIGADDIGVISVTRQEVQDQLTYIKKALPNATSLISVIHKLNPEAIRSPYRSIANTEFHHNYEGANEECREIVAFLRSIGVEALSPASGFPMEMDEYPGRTWVISHKPVAVAAGLGQMGINRNILHEKYGNFINLSTIITTATFDFESTPIDFNPCVGCRLCVQACPVGAISNDGEFNFSTCMTHNYNEFMTGFNSWVNTIVDSKNSKEFAKHYDQSENASMWQSLSFKANYKAAYCMAVCPAGEEILPVYLADQKQFKANILQPLIDKEETIYALKNSDAVAFASKLKNKKVKIIASSSKPKNIVGFIRSMPIFFQPQQSAGLDFSITFNFTGSEQLIASIRIKDKKISISSKKVKTDLTIHIASDDWLKFINKDIGLLKLILTRKLKFNGSLKYLKYFSKCFPK